MKSSTLKCLLTAIVLPLFALTLNVATPVSAEQIDRSRSFSAGFSSGEDRIPSVTDLNLSVPVDRQNSSSGTPVRFNASHKHLATSPNGKHSHRSISTQNLSTTAQAPRVKSSSSRNSIVAINITPATFMSIRVLISEMDSMGRLAVLL